MTLTHKELLMKLGAARSQYPSGWRLVEVQVHDQNPTVTYRLHRDKLRQVRRREGRYLLRTNLTAHDPARLWRYYIQLEQVEEAFKNLKGDLSIRPIYHQDERRIEAHIFIAFLAYCLHATLAQQLRPHAPGLTPRSVLDKFAGVQMLDVQIQTNRRPSDRAHALHRTRARAAAAARSAASPITGTTTAENHRHTGPSRHPRAVQTSRGASIRINVLAISKRRIR
jgi:Transposase DDE domain